MPLGELAGAGGVPVLDGVDDGAVRGDDLREQRRLGGGGPGQLAQLQVQLHLLHGQPHRLGAGGHLDVEAAVGPPLPGGRRVPGEAVDDVAQPGDLARGRPARREPGRRRRDGAVHVPELAQVRGAELGQPRVGQVGQRVVPGPHEAAAAAAPPGLDQAAQAQVGERVAQGDRGDVEHQGQVGLRGQLLPVAQQAQRDGAADPADDGGAAQGAVVEGREHRPPRVAAEHLHVPTSPVHRRRRVFHPAPPR